MTLKHTAFMQTVAKNLGHFLKLPYDGYHFGETHWLCQVYFGEERRIHYEVSRVSNRDGRQIEIGLHFESRNTHLNHRLLAAMDRHLIEIRHALGEGVRAEIWDRGWTKVYEIYPDTELTEELANQIAGRLAEFIKVVQPIYESIK
jgi:hypothetical protein